MLPEGPVKAMFVVARPVPDVWRAFSSEAGWRGWLAPDMQVKVDVGGKFSSDSTQVKGSILELRAPRKISLSWTGPAGGPASIVTFELEHRGTSTKVTVQERPGGAPPSGEEKANREATWRTQLKSLKDFVEKSSPAPERVALPAEDLEEPRARRRA